MEKENKQKAEKLYNHIYWHYVQKKKEIPQELLDQYRELMPGTDAFSNVGKHREKKLNMLKEDKNAYMRRYYHHVLKKKRELMKKQQVVTNFEQFKNAFTSNVENISSKPERN